MERIGPDSYGWVNKSERRLGVGGDVGSIEEIPKEIEVTLKELPSSIDNAIYLYGRWPFIYDNTEQSIGEMSPANLRVRLVGGLKSGNSMCFDFSSLDDNIELSKWFSPNFFPKEVLHRHELFKEETWIPLLRSEAGDPEPNLFYPKDSFKIIIVTRSGNAAPLTCNEMLRIKVVDIKTVDKSKTEGGMDELADAFGVKVVFRNSKEMLEDAFEGNLDKVKEWLEKGFDIESKDGHNHTALSEAASQGKNEVVNFLIEAGANPNTVNDRGRSPLWRAAFSGYLETIILLLNCGADPDLKDTQTRETASMVARDDKCRQIIDSFNRTVTVSLKGQRDEEIRKKLESRVQNAAQIMNSAREKIKLELFELIMNDDANALDVELTRIADEAVLTKEKPMATSQLRDDRGNTMLSFASWKGKVAVVEKLLNRIKDFSAEDTDHAVYRRVFSPNVNSRDSKGWTPLAIAAFHGHKQIVKLLLDNGGDPYIPNQYGKCAWDLAASDEIKEVLGIRNQSTLTRALEIAPDKGSLAEMQTEIAKDISSPTLEATSTTKKSTDPKHGGKKSKATSQKVKSKSK